MIPRKLSSDILEAKPTGKNHSETQFPCWIPKVGKNPGLREVHGCDFSDCSAARPAEEQTSSEAEGYGQIAASFYQQNYLPSLHMGT